MRVRPTGADRAAVEHPGQCADGGHRHHGLPRLPDARRRQHGALDGGQLGKPDFPRDHHPDQAGRQPRHGEGAGEGARSRADLRRHQRRHRSSTRRRPRACSNPGSAPASISTNCRCRGSSSSPSTSSNPPDFDAMRALLKDDDPAGLSRRSPHLGRPAGVDGPHDGADRHRRAACWSSRPWC